jgi:hypothetical protein
MVVIRDALLACFATRPGFQGQRQISGAVIPCWPQQNSSRHVQIDQFARRKQSVSVLVQSSIAILLEVKDPLENQ